MSNASPTVGVSAGQSNATLDEVRAFESTLPPYVNCVFEALLGAQGSKPLEGTGQPFDGSEPFAIVVTRARGSLRVMLPPERDLRDEVLWTLPFEPANPAVGNWSERETFEGTIGTLTLMGEIMAVDSGFTLLVVHQLMRNGEEIVHPDECFAAIVRTDLTCHLSPVEVEQE